MPRDLIEFPEVVVQPQVPALLPIGHQRLLRLAEFLETVPRNRFDMGIFANGDLEKECGSAGCALGWATTIPEFRAAGLTLSAAAWPTFQGTGGPAYIDNVPASFIAGALFFQITNVESGALFTPDNSRETPKHVAKRIRSFVAARRSA